MRQRDVFSDQASIASWALFTLHRKKLYEYRNANGVKISVKMSSPEHYQKTDLKGRREGLLPDNHKKLRIVATWGLLQEMQNSGLTET
ncbi:hypothetical protein WFL_23820 (plasmid) [Escherichia coli W]|nr:hypothetical protein WFL_23820 [Escherichia coli W]